MNWIDYLLIALIVFSSVAGVLRGLLREVIAKLQPRSDDWRKESIREMRQLISAALHLPDRAS